MDAVLPALIIFSAQLLVIIAVAGISVCIV